MTTYMQIRSNTH